MARDRPASRVGLLPLDIARPTEHTAVMVPELDLPAPIERLRDDLGHRRIEQGIETLERLRPLLQTLGPRPGCGILAGLVAQWVDTGYDHPALLEEIVARFPKNARAALPLCDYLHLRMVEAVLAMANEDLDTAIHCLLAVQSFDKEIPDAELLAIANFWLGRCYRKMGRYGEALKYTERGEALAQDCGYAEMAAIMQVTRSWLAFQKGRLQEAKALLRQAEAALKPTSDYLSRGNIQSSYGRIARRQGNYERALECFQNAILEYREGGGGQLQLARALLNLAFVERLLALDAQRKLDHAPAARHAAQGGVRERRQHIEEVRRKAAAHLDEACETYTRYQNHRGVAGVHINRGFLALDSGDLERASAEAAEAFAHGSEKSDGIVMARARTLQCIVENTAIEEQVGDCAHHREDAEAFAREAVALAGQTENRRLLARALVWQGLTFTLEPADLDAARRCCQEAVELLQPEGMERQYTWEDLVTLKTRVLQARPVEAVLRAWSAGIVENATFQQMTEEFARIVIPKVWEREGRKISKVAEKLSISPKKVRRILHSAGFTDRGAAGEERNV